MQTKHPIFEQGSIANWYTIIDGVFYYWSVDKKAWIKSCNEDGWNERQYHRAKDEQRVFRVRLKGAIRHW